MNSTEQLIRITSWNVAGKDPNLTVPKLDYLFDDSQRQIDSRPGIQIVGLQEAPSYLFSDPWTTGLSSTLKNRGYILFKRHKLSGILLYIFVLREIMLQARDFETESVKTGFGGLLGNKGGVSLRFSFNGNSFSVTNSHLAAHQDQKNSRIDDFNTIMSDTKYRIDRNTSDILSHDYSYWFGDLNFRLDDVEKHQVLDLITIARTAGSREKQVKKLSPLHNNDQLNQVRKDGLAFQDFNESLPTFLPTYKFRVGSKDAYDSENRIPAWTDRILFRCRPDAYSYMEPKFSPKIEQLFYDSLPEMILSDHKPIVSLFKVTTFDPKKFNPSPLPYEVVTFQPITDWMADKDGRLWYKISNELFYRQPKVLSAWDRIALYKDDFAAIEDYQTLVFANNIARESPSLEAREVPYISSQNNSRPSSQTSSRRGSTGSITMGTEALETTANTGTPMANPLPEDAVIGDGYKYFTVSFSDEVLIPGRYVVMYLKTNAANEYDVYGISEPFTVAPAAHHNL